MKKHPFHTLVLPGILLLCLMSADAQAQSRINPSGSRINPSGSRINPGGSRINPSGSRIQPSQSTVIRPATPMTPPIVTPPILTPPILTPPILTPPILTPPILTPPIATPIHPGYPAYPGAIYPGTVIVPSYPSAWIGPTIIRETYTEPAPTPNPYPAPGAAVPAQMPALRLVVLLGTLQHLDTATGADLGLAESRVGVSVGMLVGYAQNQPVKASGDFFGTCWDGPGYFTKSDDSKRGPFLDHPILSVNEFKPGPWEFEAGAADRRISWIRLAATLFEDQSQNPGAKSVNLPRGRRAAMREVLHRVNWTDKGVSVKSAGLSEAETFAGADVTHFGKALATFAEKTMTPTPDNERIGISEWFFPAQEIGKILSACPRFMETPDGDQLRGARAAAGKTMPAWVRPWEFRNETARYAGELWFIVVPDASVNDWLKK